MKQESKHPITVEDLLRLKRAERPPAEFWDQFDRELRAKQLSALVEKSPWWRSLPRAFAGFSRYSLPLGATAVLAITFLATRDYPTAVDPTELSSGVPVVAGSSVEKVEPAGVRADIAPQIAVSSPASELLAPRVSAPSAEQALTAARNVNIFSAVDASLADADSTFEERTGEASDDISPSARHIAANLAVAQAATPALTRGLLGATRGFEDRVMPARTALEPLAQVSTPAERSRARFATAMVGSFSGDTRGRATSANVARRISDDRVYDDDAIRRVGATGNSVAWRF